MRRSHWEELLLGTGDSLGRPILLSGPLGLLMALEGLQRNSKQVLATHMESIVSSITCNRDNSISF